MTAQRRPARHHSGLVTLREWAELAERPYSTVATEWRYRPGFPAPADRQPRATGGGTGEPLYARAQLDAWLAAQERIGPSPAHLSGHSQDELVALYQFADLIGRRHSTVYQYRRRPGFPAPADGVRYRLADLLAWWNDPANRPGQGRGGGQPRQRRPG